MKLSILPLFTLAVAFHVAPTSAETVSCTNSEECVTALGEEHYCAQGTCLASSKCQTLWDCFNPDNVYGIALCIGERVCEQGTCGINCGVPMCPDGSNPVSCVASPCEVGPECIGAVSCVDDYCGGCNMRQYDAAGNDACGGSEGGPPLTNDQDEMNQTEPAEQADESVSCSNSEECVSALGEEHYCSQGTCLPFSECQTLWDCFNPENNYAMAFCIGQVTCNEGMCGIACAEPECPDGSNEVTCDTSPCEEVSTCSGAVACVDNRCGGCNTRQYDAAGNDACDANRIASPIFNDPNDLNENTATVTQPTICSSNADCLDTTVAIGRAAFDDPYCASGKCMDAGTCSVDLDCFNPSNIYAVIECEGYVKCTDGQCGVICGDMCENGEAFVGCDADPCEATSCEEAVSCAQTNCGGCGAIHFDAAGNQVCEGDGTDGEPSTCSSNDDCPAQHYCAQGACLGAGMCNTVTDCSNPANGIFFPDCVGEITCSEGGECGKDCTTSEDQCCFSETCDDATKASCAEAQVCLIDNCSDCGVKYLNATGHEVCQAALPVNGLTSGGSSCMASYAFAVVVAMVALVGF